MIRIDQSTGLRATHTQIRISLPHLSFAETSDLTEQGYPWLETVAQPEPIDTQHIVTAGPDEEYSQGKWRQTWVQAKKPAPRSVSMRQARLALSQSGLLATVNAAMSAASEADQIEWEYATTVERYSPLVLNMAAALSLTETQLDDLFRLAGTL